MKKVVVGIVAGIIGGAINIAFLLFAPDLELAVYFSTATTWIVIGILISVCSMKTSGLINGMIISLLVSAPTLVYTVVSSPIGAVWMTIETLITGAIMGLTIEKVSARICKRS